MRLGKLFSTAGIECPENLLDLEVSAIVTDSKKVVENCIFVCLCGVLCDGHDYIDEAIRAGASVIVAEKVRGECVGGAAAILVENTRHTASLLYSAWYENPAKDMKIIGITGTNGKTSVSYMLLDIFEKAGYRCGLIGTVGTLSAERRKIDREDVGEDNMTTPSPRVLYQTLSLMKQDRVEYVFMEVSSHALAQCRTDAILFECAVFTNLTEDHLDFHKNMEEYYKAKEKLFTQSLRAVVNIDGEAGRRLVRFLRESKREFKTCSLKEGDFYALLPKTTSELNTEYSLKTPSGEYRVFLPLSGEFQVINSLQAASVALIHNISAEQVLSALATMKSIPGRMEGVSLHPKQSFNIFIDYAHTPDALEKLLICARNIRKLSEKEKKGKIILVFGCGGEREREKRKIMGQIASRLAELVVVTSDNSRNEDTREIIEQILKGIDKEKAYTVIEDRREAIEKAVCEYADEGDILLLAGKGHENYQIDKQGKHPFEEKEIIKAALMKRFE